jgi:transaldolase / glucose-6-phosphate isomerase
MSNANPLLKINSFGQSIWLDFLHREMLRSGELLKLIEKDGISGVTSNPAIFKEAIAGSNEYDGAIAELVRSGASVEEIYQNLVVEDVREAADQFRELYDATNGQNGFVSLEVSPHLARDIDATIEEGLFLWKELDRPNVMIKVPATREGCAAIRELTSEGVNINATLLFSISRYQEVAEAFIAGLEKRAQAGKSVDNIASVASFFLSRIDTLLDPELEKISESGRSQADVAAQLRGRIAVSSAKMAYQSYKQLFSSVRFEKLQQLGARPQRLLWASTGTKNPNYSDVKYVDELIGVDTVNTVPVKTINAFRDHGNAASTLETGLSEAEKDLAQLKEVAIVLEDATQMLEEDGIEKFVQPFDSLFEKLTEERNAILGEEFPDRQTLDLGLYSRYVQKRLNRLQEEGFASRLWNKDPALWKHDPETRKAIVNALGWLDVPEKLQDELTELKAFAREIRAAGFINVLVMGMGGSSMTPLCFERSLAVENDKIPLTILDTTNPETVLKLSKDLPLAQTLFIEASKSGTTAEPNAFSDYFFARLQEIKGVKAGENFIAITDPGTLLVSKAEKLNYRRIFTNFADIGGRYSALSYFGLVPAALMGLDVEKLFSSVLVMKQACGSGLPESKNPGVTLGAVMGELALHGRNKVTFLLPESIQTLGLWLEQLIAESTGKEETGVLPVAGEPLGDPGAYGDDRLFVYYQIENESSPTMEILVGELKKLDHPVVTVRLQKTDDLVQEFFRWEIATATAGAILRINPFDQPNVQESKSNTLRILEDLEKQTSKDTREPLFKDQDLQVFGVEAGNSLKEILESFLGRQRPRDYVALMAYLPEKPSVEKKLQEIHGLIRNKFHLATTFGYGPRFLHSTGQFHKGGPNSGLFIQITADPPEDAAIPGAHFTFGTLIEAQARGDMEALQKYGRRTLRIHLREGLDAGLSMLAETIKDL